MDGGHRRSNLNPDFIKVFSEKLELKFVEDGKGDLWETFGPEDIFNYAYSVSPSYASGYADAYADYTAQQQLSVINQGTPPKGAIVFYQESSTTDEPGHIGIADGEGNLISVLTDTQGVTHSSDNIGKPKLGWIFPNEYIFGNDIINTTMPTDSVSRVSTGTTIQYGQEVTGEIVNLGDYQDWTFTGEAGDIVTIRMSQYGGASLFPHVELLDPSGTTVSSDDGTPEGRIENYALAFSGTYTIRASGLYGNYTGGYKLDLELKPLPITITYGQEVTGQIALTGDYQDWKFVGQAGDVVTIRMSQYGGASLFPHVELLDPSGTIVSSNDGTPEASIENYALTSSGTFTIRASGLYGNYTGGYKLDLELKPLPITITYGQEVTGQIALTGDYQDWKFVGQAGDVVTIRMSQYGGASLFPHVELLDPSGTIVSSNDGTPEASIENYALTSSGTFTIRASGLYGNYTGGYELSLALKPSVPKT